MKLVCPHCAKVIELSDSLAGQTTTCSLCQGPLTVPFAATPEAPPAAVPPAGPPKQPAPLPPPPPSLPIPDPLGTTTAWQPPSASGTVIPPLPAPAPAASGSGRGAEILGKLQQFQLPPGFEQWLGLGALVLLFFLFLFPWVTISVGDIKIAEQSGAAVGFGTASASEEGKFLTKNLSAAGLVTIAFICSILGVLLLAVILVEKLVHAPAVQNVKPTLQRIASLRDVLVLGFLVVITLVLLMHWLISFPLEHAAYSDKAGDTMLTGLKLVSDGVDKVKNANMVGMQWLQRRGWFTLALLISLLATLWCGIRWLGTKGYTRHWPKLVVQWPSQSTT